MLIFQQYETPYPQSIETVTERKTLLQIHNLSPSFVELPLAKVDVVLGLEDVLQVKV